MSTPPDAFVREQVEAALRGGDFAEAERLLRGRIERAPGDVEAIAALTDILAQTGRIREGTALLERVLTIEPAAHGLRIKLSALQQQQEHFPLALRALREVPAEDRQSFDLKIREATLLGRVGRRDDEVAIYEQLLKEQPLNAGLWMTHGNALNYAGRLAEAIAALRKATKIAPGFGEPWWSLANLKRFRFEDGEIAAMEKALRGNLQPVDALHFHFALGRAFEQRRDYARSFDHYAAGNRIRAAGLTPAQTIVTPFVDAAIAAFTRPLFDHYRGAGADSEGPIFIVGLQRSGSTLIEQMLASHPEIEGTAELVTMKQLGDELAALAAANGRTLLEQIASSPPELFRRIGEEYLARTRPYRLEGKRFFIDKLPANWMSIGLIRLALPRAKIIDARRHPMAAGFSNFKQHYATGVTFAYSLESIGRFYADYVRLMRHFDTVQPGAVLHVLNERLIEEPEVQVRRMMEYIGVSFDPACLDFHANKRAVHTPSADQVRQPINREGVDAWRNYQPWLGPLRDALGHALDDWQE
jgi:Flp pilus assembly protein TadD